MKNTIFFIAASVSLLMVLSGCGPELAESKYGPTETQWQNYVSKSYSEWEPPSTPPPMVVQGDDQDKTIIEIVPEPSSGMNEPLPTIIDERNHSELPNANIDQEAGLPTTYTVQKGDTLWSIAYKFYDNGRAWRAIQNANKDKLPTPDKLKAGMTLTIPAPVK